MASNAAVTEVEARSPGIGRKIWVDLDNSPHVPFFRPIIDELEKLGFMVFVTARDAYQVKELLIFYEISCTVIGKHYGRTKFLKRLGTFWRAIQLTARVRKEKQIWQSAMDPGVVCCGNSARDSQCYAGGLRVCGKSSHSQTDLDDGAQHYSG